MIPQEKEGPPDARRCWPSALPSPWALPLGHGIAPRLWHEVEGHCLKNTVPSAVLSSWRGA